MRLLSIHQCHKLINEHSWIDPKKDFRSFVWATNSSQFRLTRPAHLTVFVVWLLCF